MINNMVEGDCVKVVVLDRFEVPLFGQSIVKGKKILIKNSRVWSRSYYYVFQFWRIPDLKVSLKIVVVWLFFLSVHEIKVTN